MVRRTICIIVCQMLKMLWFNRSTNERTNDPILSLCYCVVPKVCMPQMYDMDRRTNKTQWSTRCTKRMAAVKCSTQGLPTIVTSEWVFGYFWGYAHGNPIKTMELHCRIPSPNHAAQQSFFALFVVSLLSTLHIHSFAKSFRHCIAGASRIRGREPRNSMDLLGLAWLGLTAINASTFELWFMCACGF